MNERIEELAVQAGFFGCMDEGAGLVFRKFAELIVRECAGAVASVSPCFGDYRDQIEVNMRDHCTKKVMEHFGIE